MSKVKPIEWNPSTMEAVDDSKEDGEISSHDDSEVDELIDVDYNILPRPMPSNETEMTTIDTVGQSSTNLQTIDEDPSAGNAEYYSDNDDDDMFQRKSSSDSDSDEPSFKRKPFNSVDNRMSYTNQKPFNNPNASNYLHAFNTIDAPSMSASSTFPSISQETVRTTPPLQETPELSVVEQKMRSYQEKRSKNFNIWSEVLLEEQQQAALEKLEGVDMSNTATIVERGPESYTYKPTIVNRKRKRNAVGNEKKSKMSQDEDQESDISSAGLSDDDLHYIRECTSSSSSGNNTPTHSVHPKADKDKSSKKHISISQLKKAIAKLRGRRLSYFMAQKLKEPKHQLIVRACEILGKKYCMHMFIKTMKIENKGGLLIKSGNRRRTPGGIFFYMVRNDKKYPQEKIELIFEVDKQIQQKDKKKRRTVRMRQQHERLARLQDRQVRFQDNPSAEGGGTKMDSQGDDHFNESKQRMEEDGEVSSQSSDSEYYSDDSSDYAEETNKPYDSSMVTMDEDDTDILDVTVPINDIDDL